MRWRCILCRFVPCRPAPEDRAALTGAIDAAIAANRETVEVAKAVSARQDDHQRAANGIRERAEAFREKNAAHAQAVRSTIDELLERMNHV